MKRSDLESRRLQKVIMFQQVARAFNSSEVHDQRQESSTKAPKTLQHETTY